MNKNKTRNTALIIVITLIISLTVIIVTRQTNNPSEISQESDIILFYSLACPHCQNVSEYITNNNIKEKYNFSELEISENKKNSAKLIEKAKICGYDSASLGVPFLWTGEKCLTGDIDIINFFKP